MLDQLVEKYIQLRDKKAEHKAAYEAQIASIDAALTRLENHFLAQMQEQGLTSLPTAVGTPYLQHRTSASVADWNTLLGFIQRNNLWSMLEKRVSTTAVEEYRAANDDLPPGVNWREAVVVNVRRS